jgi:hypothetical protein
MCKTRGRIWIRIWIGNKTMPIHNTGSTLVPLISLHMKMFSFGSMQNSLARENLLVTGHYIYGE